MNRKSVMARIRIFSVLFMALFMIILAVTAGICTKATAGDYKRSFVSSTDLSGTGPSVLYQPTIAGTNSQIGIVIMHPSGNFLEHPTVVGSPDPGTS